MQNWKVNQRIFEFLGEKKDILGVHIPGDKIKVVTGDLITAIQKQFYDMEYVSVPAKSYCVALVYAVELTKDFGGSVLDYLGDAELLLNDIHFVPYSQAKDVYDYFLVNTEWQSSPMADRVKEYYRQEILLEGVDYAA